MWQFRESTIYVAVYYLALLTHHGLSFQPIYTNSNSKMQTNRRMATSLSYANADIETLKLPEIKAELQDRGVSFADCFDRESMVGRLREAREGNAPTAATLTAATSPPTKSNKLVIPDKEKILADLRSKTVKDLKLECSRRCLRYASFLEKEDFVQAVFRDIEAVLAFSVSGALRPGKSSEISGEQLDQEITKTDTPILLDV
jgi:hypothetical protein